MYVVSSRRASLEPKAPPFRGDGLAFLLPPVLLEPGLGLDLPGLLRHSTEVRPTPAFQEWVVPTLTGTVSAPGRLCHRIEIKRPAKGWDVRREPYMPEDHIVPSADLVRVVELALGPTEWRFSGWGQHVCFMWGASEQLVTVSFSKFLSGLIVLDAQLPVRGPEQQWATGTKFFYTSPV